MGETLRHLEVLDSEFVMHTYARKPVAFVRGSGMRLFDDDGREYLDFISGIGSVNLGHGHPAVSMALCEQATKLIQVSNLFYVEHRDEAAEALVGLLGGGMKVFYTNSGAESIEGAIKLARRWAGEHKPGAYRIVTANGSFHGRTMAALAATGQPAKQEAFKPLPEGFFHVPFNDPKALEIAVDGSVAAVMLEVVQGEGGVWPADPEYLEAARTICDKAGALLILDEVQTGFFRTGPAFAHQAFGVRPDIVCVAKAMANGLPVGAVVAARDVADAFLPGDHGSTFSGSPVIAAAARATMEALVAERLGQNAIETGRYLRARLNDLAESSGAISDVRGIGLMIGVTLNEPLAADVGTALLERGIVVNNIGTGILRFLPPLVCGVSEVDTLLAALTDILEGIGGS